PFFPTYTKPQDLLLEIPIPAAPDPNIYLNWVAYLDALRERGDICDWYGYSYDWRASWSYIVNRGQVYDGRCFRIGQMDCEECQQLVGDPEAGLRLEDKIAELANAPGNTGHKVWIVAHSYGGLVAKALLTRLPSVRNDVAGLVLVASPQLGTP